jgi:type IV pili sensor histidine kinase/response regulator
LSLRQHGPHGGARGDISRAIALLCLGTICLIGSGDLLARDVQVGRYASVSTAPTESQANLLSTMVRVKFPSRVRTVGGAVQHLLGSSGYRLTDETAADPARFDLLELKLPKAHRSLGPMALRNALETLGGPAFRLVEDPLHRLVSFERCASPGRSPSNTRDPDRR